MEPRLLTDNLLKSLKPAPKGERYCIPDRLSPAFRVVVNDTGRKTFVLWKRLPGVNYCSALKLGEYGGLSLADGRVKAGRWTDIIKSGRDPREVERAEREAAAEAEIAARNNTFGQVAEDYIRLQVRKRRRGKDDEREIRKELILRWKDRPIAGLTKKKDIIPMLDEIVARGAPYQAHSMLSHLKTMFGWAIERDTYGIEHAPTDRMRPSRVIGKKASRQRVLNDDEIFAFWRGCGRLDREDRQHPEATLGHVGACYRLLLLTGARHSEIASARRREINLGKKLLTVPRERAKSDSEHIVCLSDVALRILGTVPRWNRGDYVFSSTSGKTPIDGRSKAKKRLDVRMLRTLRALARTRGDDPPTVELDRWVIHDLRRTLRTRLSALRVDDTVAELILGHGRKGIQKVYDLHRYEPEMREALQAWADKLLSIVELPPKPTDNIVAFPALDKSGKDTAFRAARNRE